MKKMLRILSFALCFALLTTAMPVNLLSLAYASEAEEQEVAALEILVTEAPAEVESQTEAPSADAAEDVPTHAPATQAPEGETESAPEVSAEATQAPEREPQPESAVDYTRSAAASPAFTVGYAQILSDAKLYAGEDAVAEIRAEMAKGGVVYAVGRSSDAERLKVVFNAGAELGMETGWMDADQLRPIEPVDEAADYVRFCGEQEDVIYYNTLPLNAIEYTYMETEAPAATEVPAETEAPEATEVPSETEAPEATEAPAETGDVQEDEPEADGDDATDADDDLYFVDVPSDGTVSLEQLQIAMTSLTAANTENEQNAQPVNGQGDADVKLESISFTEASIQLLVGATREMSDLVQLNPEDAQAELIYSTDSTDVLSVNPQTGAVQALAAGEANVVVSSATDASVSASCAVTVLEEAQSIGFAVTGKQLGIGETFDLTTLLKTEPEGSFASCTFKSSNSKYVSVNSAGVVKGVKAGKTVTITATSHNGKTATIKVRAYNAPKSVTLKLSQTTLGVEQTATASVSFPSNTYSLYTIESDHPEILSVDENGNMTALSAGTATITVTTKNNRSASATVTVLEAPDEISASCAEYTLGVGMTSKAVYGVCPENTLCAFEYASSDESIVSVNASTGEMSAKAVGTATITITSKNSKQVKTSCEVTVKPAPESIKFSKSSLSLGIGNSYDLMTLLQITPDDTNASYTFKSSNSKYVSVSSAGVVKGVKAGKTVTITATSHNGKTATIKVRAYNAPKSVTLKLSQSTLGVEQTATASVSFPSNTYSLYTIESDHPEILSVDENGNMTALSAGTATITVTTKNNRYASATVTVLEAPDEISASCSEYTLGVGMTSKAVYGVCPENTLCAFEYASSDESIVSVNASTGEMSAKAVGTATITITSKNSKQVKTTCEVTVKPAPESIKFSKSSLPLGIGNSYDLMTLLQITPDDTNASYTFKSSNSKYVSVNSAGVVKGVKAGKTVTITATSHNGKTATIKVRAYNAPKSVTLKLSQTTLGVEQTATASVSFPSNTYSLYTIESDHPEILSVDEDGNMTALSAGTATITVTTKNNRSASAMVTVLEAPDEISASCAEYTLGVGMSSKAVYGVCPENTLCSFEYASSDESIVSVNASTGEMSAKAVGTATITITSKNSKRVTASCEVTVKPAPESIKFSKSSLPLGIGNSYDLMTLLQITPDDTNASYTFKSSNSKYVSVNSAGVVKGVKAGKTVTITATSHNGKTATIKVRAYKVPGKISLNTSSLELGVGMSRTLSVSFPSNTYSLYSFTSSDESVATVNEDGEVTAIAEGTATITATTTLGSRSASCTVTVKKAPTYVEFLYEEYEISEGMKLTLDPIIDEDALADFSFASSDTGIATVNSNGVVTGVKSGTAKITVTTHNGVSNQREYTIIVTPAPQTLDYNDMPTLVIAKGDTVVIPEPIALDASGNECAATYTFTSSNSSYAKVSNGMVKGVKAGKTVKITATSHNGKKAYFYLKVTSASITNLQLSQTDATLFVNDDYMEAFYLYAEPTGTEVNYGSMRYVSSNPNVAYVTEEGVVVGVTPGTATITVTSYNGKSAVCTVRVKALTTSLSFAQSSVSITEGESYQLAPVMDAGTDAILSYASSDASVATVNEDGLVTALKTGDVTITVSTQNELSAELNLHIIAAPKSISLSVSGMNLHVGDEITLNPVLKADSEEFNQTVSFSSSAPSVASVDANGKVTALKPGTANISATTCNGLKAECRITVLEDAAAARVEFAWESATIVKGDTAALKFTLNREAYERGFTLESSAPDVLSIDSANYTITAKGAASEGVKLTLTINAQEGEVETLAEEISCTIYIVESTQAAFSVGQLTLKSWRESDPAASRGQVTLAGLPENLIGTYALYVEDEALATYDPQTGLVQALDLSGETSIVCKTFDREIRCKLTIEHSTVYRAVVIGEYNNSTATSSNLPFSKTNTDAVKGMLSYSSVDGVEFEDITCLPNNPTQAQIASAISTTFADATEDDVSFVYILCHGYNGRADINNGGYFFGLPNWTSTNPDTYVTSEELMSWLKPIGGNVVMVLITCKSGGFIKDQQSALKAEGNIAVITAQTYDKNASYFIRSSDGYSIEFATYALCESLGHDYEDASQVLSSINADSNADGNVTVSELFSYMRSATSSTVLSVASKYFKAGSKTGFLVPGIKTKAQLKAWGGQTPQYYIPDSMKDVVVYGRT